jgi:4-hydroxybenzoate polyprenyltransferase
MRGLFEKIGDYLSLVKFSHTVFAMPFALLGFFTAIESGGGEFSARLLILILLCMVFARNAAMGFNRYADKRIDALNPRTNVREIPAGKISPVAALVFVVINSILFIVAAGLINRLTLILAPVALIVILGYSLTKRVTSLSHLFLGLSLSLSPVGAYISVTGSFDLMPIIYGLIVITWVGGFDIIYSLQDADFDADNNLHSIPSALGASGAIMVSRALHISSLALVISAWVIGGKGLLFLIASLLFGGMLLLEHIIAKPGDNRSINMAFAKVNSFAGLLFSSFAIADLYFHIPLF